MVSVQDTPAARAGIGERIARARIDAGYTNKSDFARQVGVQPNTIYRYEKGEMVPEVWQLETIASLTRVSLDWLVRGEPAAAAGDVFAVWKASDRGKAAKAETLSLISTVLRELRGYVPTPGFFDLFSVAVEHGLTVDEALRAAKASETALGT